MLGEDGVAIATSAEDFKTALRARTHHGSCMQLFQGAISLLIPTPVLLALGSHTLNCRCPLKEAAAGLKYPFLAAC